MVRRERTGGCKRVPYRRHGLRGPPRTGRPPSGPEVYGLGESRDRLPSWVVHRGSLTARMVTRVGLPVTVQVSVRGPARVRTRKPEHRSCERSYYPCPGRVSGLHPDASSVRPTSGVPEDRFPGAEVGSGGGPSEECRVGPCLPSDVGPTRSYILPCHSLGRAVCLGVPSPVVPRRVPGPDVSRGGTTPVWTWVHKRHGPQTTADRVCVYPSLPVDLGVCRPQLQPQSSPEDRDETRTLSPLPRLGWSDRHLGGLRGRRKANVWVQYKSPGPRPTTRVDVKGACGRSKVMIDVN